MYALRQAAVLSLYVEHHTFGSHLALQSSSMPYLHGQFCAGGDGSGGDGGGLGGGDGGGLGGGDGGGGDGGGDGGGSFRRKQYDVAASPPSEATAVGYT